MYLGSVSYEQVVWCFLCGCGWPGVLSVLCEGEPCMPVVLLRSAEYSEILLQGLIGSFARSVHLRVICRADVLMDV